MLDLVLIGEKIKELRRNAKMTQSDFAKQMNVSCQAVSNWERGTALPDLENLTKIAESFGVLVDDLLRSSKEAVFLGVDGGGTKTEFVAVNSEGRVLKRFSEGSSNPNDIGYQNTAALICDGVEKVLLEYPGLKSVFCGIAGIATGDNAARLSSDLKKRYPQLKIGIKNDSFNLLATCDRADMAIISGTGSVVFVRKGEEFIRLGGWGYLLDQAGSGYDMGRDAICAALEEEDFNTPPSLLASLVREKMKTERIWNKIGKVYSEGKHYIASFASVVFDAYRKGDKKAEQIVDKSAKALAKLLNMAVKHYSAKPVAVASGGIFEHHGDIIIPNIKKYSDAELVINGLPPVYGACRMACSLEIKELGEEFFEKFSESYGEIKK